MRLGRLISHWKNLMEKARGVPVKGACDNRRLAATFSVLCLPFIAALVTIATTSMIMPPITNRASKPMKARRTAFAMACQIPDPALELSRLSPAIERYSFKSFSDQHKSLQPQRSETTGVRMLKRATTSLREMLIDQVQVKK